MNSYNLASVRYVPWNYKLILYRAHFCVCSPWRKSHHVNHLQEGQKQNLPIYMGKERYDRTKSKPREPTTNENDWFWVTPVTESAILPTVWLMNYKTRINPAPFCLWRNIPVLRILWLSIRFKETRLYCLVNTKLTSRARIARHFQRNEQFLE